MKLRNPLNTIAPMLGIAILSAFIHSCADDELYHPQLSDDKITIQATVSDVWLPGGKSRSGENESHGAEVTNGYKVECESSPEPLYIFESVSDKFESTTSEQSQPQSRGAVVGNQASFDKTTMGVYAYYTHHTEQPFYMENIPYGKSGNYWKSQGAEYLWPVSTNDENVLQFFAYSPYNAKDSKGNSLVNVKKSGNDVTIHYTVPDSLKDQHDLLISDLTNIDDISSAQKNGVNLNFHHALTSVRFITDKYDGEGDKSPGMYPGVVTNVTIKNIIGEASYNVSTGEWIVDENQPLWDYSFKCASANMVTGADVVDDFSSNNSNILGEQGFTLMMLPQSSYERKENKPILEITFIDAATKTVRLYQKEFDIDWQQGKSVCYYISTSEMKTVYTFDVSTIDENSDPQRAIYACGNAGADKANVPISTVTSYYTVYQIENGEIVSSGKCPAKWNVEYAWENDMGEWVNLGEKPEYFITPTELLHGEGILGVDKEVTEIPIEINQISGVSISSDEITALRTRSPKVDFDLSTNGSVNDIENRNTANCYIVSSGGTYLIPIVYGNSIKNGKLNESAYKSSLIGDNYLTNFVKHDGLQITKPWIADNLTIGGEYIKPNHAELVRYQSINRNNPSPSITVERTLANIDGNLFIRFNVNRERILPGNAVIAVKDSYGVTLWSWHIWITDCFGGNGVTDPSAVVSVSNGTSTYQIMRYALGQTKKHVTTYGERKLRLRYTQYDSRNSKREEIFEYYTQHEYDSDEYTECLYYQFGRKDPLYSYHFYKFIDTSGSPILIGNHRKFEMPDKDERLEVAPITNIETAIKNPLIIYNTGGFAFTTTYSNLWNTNANKTYNSSVKTVYDPCPSGYMVPPAKSIFDYFVNNLNFDSNNQILVCNAYNPSISIPRSLIFSFTNSNSLNPNRLYSPFYSSEYQSNGNSSYCNNFTVRYDDGSNPQSIFSYPSLTSLRPSWLMAIWPILEPN